MRIKNGQEEKYAQYKKLNSEDGYSKGVVDFTEVWADLMEERLAKGEKLADIYKETSNEADKKFGITGFMYGCAVQGLAQFWEHGEELRVLHNVEHGVKAEAQGVVNPAVFTIGGSEE